MQKMKCKIGRRGDWITLDAIIVFVLVTSLFLPFCGEVYSQAKWISFNGTNSPCSPELKVLESNDLKTTIQIVIPGMWVENRIIEQQTYQVLKIPNCNTTDQVGKPEIPAIRKLVGIHPFANVTMEIKEASSKFLENYFVFPFQIPLVDSICVPQPFVIDHKQYVTDAFYPVEIAVIGKPAIWRDVRVVHLSLYPVTFNPVSKRIKVCHDFTVELTYSGTTNENPLLHPPQKISPQYEKMYREEILNYEYLRLGEIATGGAYGSYLIITPGKYYSEIKPLGDWKHLKGVETKIDTFTAGQADTTQIKNYIISDYNSRGTDYVLLVGNTDDLPIYKRWNWVQENPPAPHPIVYSDMWYALITADDLPDLAIGRMSVENDIEVTTIVNKILSYEKYLDWNWNVNCITLVAHKEAYPQKYTGCKNAVKDTIQTYSSLAVTTLYGGEEGVTNDDVINTFQNNGGMGILNYRGHGDNLLGRLE